MLKSQKSKVIKGRKCESIWIRRRNSSLFFVFHILQEDDTAVIMKLAVHSSGKVDVMEIQREDSVMGLGYID